MSAPAPPPDLRERLIDLLVNCAVAPWGRDAAEARADEIIRGMGGE